MVVSGERSGKLVSVMQKVGRVYEAKSETTTKNLSVLLEPILLFVVWLGVMTLAVGIMLPIYSLVGDLNGKNSSSYRSKPAVKVGVPKASSVSGESGKAQSQTNEKEKNAILSPPGIPALVVLPKLRILPTGLDYLNVREEPDAGSRLLKQIFPGDIFEYSAEEAGWYEIILDSSQTGWVYGQYVELIEEDE